MSDHEDDTYIENENADDDSDVELPSDIFDKQTAKEDLDFRDVYDTKIQESNTRNERSLTKHLTSNKKLLELLEETKATVINHDQATDSSSELSCPY